MGSPSERDPAFRSLRVIRDRGREHVTYEVTPELQVDPDLARHWRRLPQFPYLFEALSTDGPLLLRFTAIEWKRSRLHLRRDPSAAARAATAGVSIARAFEIIHRFGPKGELGWFTCPFVAFDLEGRPRLGFQSPDASPETANSLPPEVIDHWPHADERALVYAVGQLLLGMVVLERETLASPFAQVVRRCLATHPGRRFPTLSALRDALGRAGARRTPADGAIATWAWEQIESGLGFLLVERWNDALARFDAAQRFCIGTPPLLAIARRYAIDHGAETRPPPMNAEALAEQPQLGPPDEATSRIPATITLTSIPARTPEWIQEQVARWTSIEPTARQLESDRDPLAALALYRTVGEAPAHAVSLNTALARTHLELGDTGHAVDYARRALARDATSIEAWRIQTIARLRRQDFAEALICIAAWADLAPDDAAMHYARGKVLMNLSRLPEAREAFERAAILEPCMLEAMLLRREVDRSTRRARQAVGVQQQGETVLSPDLRHVLLGGTTAEVLVLLGEPRFADDVLAQLHRAHLLAAESRVEEALAIFQRFTHDPEHRVAALTAISTALLDLDRADAALSAIDHLIAAAPAAVVALELRARALQQLGRTDEAEAERKRFAQQMAVRSEVLVRQARST